MKSLILSYVMLFCSASFFINSNKCVATASINQCCLSGWTFHDGFCYRIINRIATRNETESTCVQYKSSLTDYPRGFSQVINYKGFLWTKTLMSIKTKLDVDMKGRPLCAMDPIQQCKNIFQMNGPTTFAGGKWLIPNSKAAFETLKQFSGTFWIGLYKCGGLFYWGDRTTVSEQELRFLPINTYNGNDTRCAVYGLTDKVEFIDCRKRMDGLSKLSTDYEPFGHGSSCENKGNKVTTSKASTETSFVASTQPITLRRTTTRSSHVTTETPVVAYTQRTSLRKTTSRSSHVTLDTTTGDSNKTHTGTKPSPTLRPQPTDTNDVNYSQTFGGDKTSLISRRETTEAYQVNTSTTQVDERYCYCRNVTTEPETKAELQKLFPRRNETSRYKRSKISIPDERRSSQVIGGVAVIAMVIPVVLIVSADVISLIQSAFFINIFKSTLVEGQNKIQIV